MYSVVSACTEHWYNFIEVLLFFRVKAYNRIQEMIPTFERLVLQWGNLPNQDTLTWPTGVNIIEWFNVLYIQ